MCKYLKTIKHLIEGTIIETVYEGQYIFLKDFYIIHELDVLILSPSTNNVKNEILIFHSSSP